MAGKAGIEIPPNNAEMHTNVETNAISEQKESFIREHLATGQTEIEAMIKTPFAGLYLVAFSDGVEKIYDIDGFHPEEIPRGEWNEQIKAWYEKHTNEN